VLTFSAVTNVSPLHGFLCCLQLRAVKADFFYSLKHVL